MRLKPELQSAFSGGRLLILSPFEAKQKQVTAVVAAARNCFVGALADRLIVTHAVPGSRTMRLCDGRYARGKQIATCPLRRIRLWRDSRTHPNKSPLH